MQLAALSKIKCYEWLAPAIGPGQPITNRTRVLLPFKTVSNEFDTTGRKLSLYQVSDTFAIGSLHLQPVYCVFHDIPCLGFK